MTMSFWSVLGNIGKALNPFSGIIGAAGSIASTAMTNAQNMKMMREQQAYNTKEREASQVYNTSERIASQMFQDRQRIAQNQYAEDIYNQYQSPAALVEQYQAAGLNPRLAIDGKSVGNISAASGSTGGAPSGSHIQPLGVTPPYMNAQGYASAFGNIAEGLKALGEAKKSGIDVQYMEQEYLETIKGMKLDNAAQELLNSVNMKYLDKEQRLKLLNFVQDLKNKKLEGNRLEEAIKGLAKDNIIKQNEIDTWYDNFNVHRANVVSDTREKETRAAYNVANTGLAYANIDFTHANTKLALERIRTEKTQQRLNSMQAGLALAMTGNEKARFEGILQDNLIKSREAELKDLSLQIAKATKDDQIKALQKEYQATAAKAQKDIAYVKQIYGEDGANWYANAVDWWMSSLGRILGGSGAALINKLPK